MKEKRQILHISMISFALLLKFLTYWQALILALLAILFNLFILPRLRGSENLWREGEKEKKYSWGIVLYPISVFILIAIFPLPLAAAAWALMAVGDGMATILGEKFGALKLFWNKEKSLCGFLSFIVFSIPASFFFFYWTKSNVFNSSPFFLNPTKIIELSWTTILLYCLIASLVTAIFESLKIKINDNLLVPLAGGLIFWILIYQPFMPIFS